MSQYRLGLVSVSFRGHTPNEILEAVRTAGLDCIEWGSDIHAPCKDLACLYEIADLQKQYGVLCSSYGTYFKFGKTPIEELIDYITAAKILGTKILRVWCGRKSGANMTAEERAQLVAECHAAAKAAAQNGVTLCLECHQGTFTEQIEDALFLMREINSPHFRMYWQPFKEKTAAENQAYAQAIAPYVEHLHVFNWQGENKLPLADAASDWRTYLNPFPAPRTLLLEFMPDDQIESLAVEANALRAIIGEAI